jgi:hypothetical protein
MTYHKDAYNQEPGPLSYRSGLDDQTAPTTFALLRTGFYCLFFGTATVGGLAAIVWLSLRRGGWRGLGGLVGLAPFATLFLFACLSLVKMLRRRSRHPFE